LTITVLPSTFIKAPTSGSFAIKVAIIFNSFNPHFYRCDTPQDDRGNGFGDFRQNFLEVRDGMGNPLRGQNDLVHEIEMGNKTKAARRKG
jgi:hypothetical protein